jgi:hypothetical protein
MPTWTRVGPINIFWPTLKVILPTAAVSSVTDVTGNALVLTLAGGERKVHEIFENDALATPVYWDMQRATVAYLNLFTRF